MNSTYGWLYQKYAYPLLEKQREKAREEMKALCRECGLDPEQQLTFTDQMEYSSFRAGAAAFSIGIYFGIQFVSNPFFSKLKETMERYQIDLYSISAPLSGSSASGKTNPHNIRKPTIRT